MSSMNALLKYSMRHLIIYLGHTKTCYNALKLKYFGNKWKGTRKLFIESVKYCIRFLNS